MTGSYEPIKQLALKILTVPDSGAPIERIFSLAGMNTSKLRNRTKPVLLTRQGLVRPSGTTESVFRAEHDGGVRL